MCKKPRACEPSWCYCFITETCTQTHINTQGLTRAHMLWWTEITRKKKQTFWAQDEVVNVWPRGHAWALTALFNYSLWGHHLYVDDLSRQKTATHKHSYRQKYAKSGLLSINRFTNADKILSFRHQVCPHMHAYNTLYNWVCDRCILEVRAKSTKLANNFLSNDCAECPDCHPVFGTNMSGRVKGRTCISPGPRCCRRCSSSCLMLWLLPSPPGSWTPWSQAHVPYSSRSH